MWKKIENQIRLYFGFSQTETRGTFVLLIILSLLLVVPLLLKEWNSSTTSETLPATEQQTLEQISKELEQAIAVDIDSVQKNIDKPAEQKQQVELFTFNPNLISVEDWTKLGIDSRLASRIQNYTAKGGRFRIKSDLQKIYGFPKDRYETLSPYIDLPQQIIKESKIYVSSVQNHSEDKKQETIPTANYTQKKPKKMPPASIELNEADTAMLKKIKGIGEVLSDRIVRFRDKIGGFYSISQLEEVYGLEGEVLDEMKRVCRLDTDTNIRKININNVNEKSLAAHPYVSPTLAKIIVNYRKQHGKFGELTDLHKIKGISHEVIDRIAPYLSF